MRLAKRKGENIKSKSEDKRMKPELPTGVKYAIILNWISVVVYFICGILLVLIVVPILLRGAANTGKEMSGIVTLLIVLGLLAIFYIPAILLIILNKALANLKDTARIWQIIISFLGIFGFPIGTIVYGICLYFLFFDEKTKEAFKANYIAPSNKLS